MMSHKAECGRRCGQVATWDRIEAPLCRRHHRTKQAPGWTLTQPQPGTLVWTAPHGRSYTVTPSTYLC
jgi:hypothetical protein